VSHLVIDDLGDLAAWKARTPAGGASTAITIEPGPGPAAARTRDDDPGHG
jgi:hypothetical protein